MREKYLSMNKFLKHEPRDVHKSRALWKESLLESRLKLSGLGTIGSALLHQVPSVLTS